MEDLEMVGVTMIQKQNVLIVMDMVIGHVLVQRRETKENVTTVGNLDIKQESVLQKEEEAMIVVDREAKARVEVEVGVGVEVAVGVEMEMLGEEAEARVEARVLVREVIANNNNLLIMPIAISTMSSRLESILSLFSPLSSFPVLFYYYFFIFYF